MNKADTPDNGDFKPLLSETQSEPVDCPFYSVLPNQNLDQSPMLEPRRQEASELDNQNNTNVYTDSDFQVLTLNQEQWESQIITSADADMSENDDIPAPSSDWVAEPDSASLAAIDAEFQQMLTLNHELRTANEELYKRVEELTSCLADSDKALQFQKKRYSVTETMLKQQTQELCAVQEQVKSVYQQLDNSLQNVQRQETLIETYKAQLEFSQQRLAQLERECAMLVTNYNSQSQQLIQSETACRELRTRLMRQQRQTLQFKAALEKCLDPVEKTSGDDEVPTCQTITDDSPALKKFKSLFVNAQPIKPWSAESESISDKESIEFDIIPNDSHNTPQTESTEAPPVRENSDQETVSSFDEQIDSVIQMYFVSTAAPTQDQSQEETNINQLAASFEQDDIWDTVANEVDASSKTDDITTQEINNRSDSNNNSIIPEIVIEPSSQKTSNTNSQEEVEDYWAEVSQLTHLDLPATESPHHPSHNIDDANSPSPVVYPSRPPKGRKSLSSVQLPKFPTKPQD
jgi:hypothetical protein